MTGDNVSISRSVLLLRALARRSQPLLRDVWSGHARPVISDQKRKAVPT